MRLLRDYTRCTHVSAQDCPCALYSFCSFIGGGFVLRPSDFLRSDQTKPMRRDCVALTPEFVPRTFDCFICVRRRLSTTPAFARMSTPVHAPPFPEGLGSATHRFEGQVYLPTPSIPVSLIYRTQRGLLVRVFMRSLLPF